MASRQIFVNICRNCRIAFKHTAARLRMSCVSFKYAEKSLLTTSVFLVFCEAKQKLDLQAPDQKSPKQEHLLKAASANAADTVTTLVSQTAFSIIEMQQKYKDMVSTLIQLLEYHITVLGSGEEEERVGNIITEARGWLQTYQKHIEDLELLLSSVQKLADASAEVAFLAGSEFISTSLGERVYHTERHLDIAREQRQQMEAQLQEVEAQCIEAIARHAEKEERRKRAEDAMFSGDESEEGERHEGTSEKDVVFKDFEDMVDEEFIKDAEKDKNAKENREMTF